MRSPGALWRRLTGRRPGRAHRTVRHGGRRYHLEHTVPTSVPYIEGTLTPRPRIVGTSQDFTGHTVRTEAELTFVRWHDGHGRFNSIRIPQEHHRQGIATAMVLALFDTYPDTRWHNSHLNDHSGPFFTRIHELQPLRMAPVDVADDRTYQPGTFTQPD